MRQEQLVPSTLLGKCARISLNFLRKRSISTEGSFSLSEKKVVIVSTEELHFYGTDTPFYWKDQVVVSTEEALDSPEKDRSFLGSNLSLLYRTVSFTQNTTKFFKEGWHNLPPLDLSPPQRSIGFGRARGELWEEGKGGSLCQTMFPKWRRISEED